MAILEHLGLSLELRFRQFAPDDWVKGEFIMRHQDQLVFRDEDLKRSPGGWALRSPGAMLFNEDQGQTLLPTLKQVLDTNKSDYWKPIEPDMMVFFYPDGRFPMMPPEPEGLQTEKRRIDRENLRKEAGGMLPDDVFAIYVFADAYNWYDGYCYEGQGFGMLMKPTWEKVRKFYAEAQKEWEKFVVSERVNERIAERIKAQREYDAEQERLEREWLQSRPPRTDQ